MGRVLFVLSHSNQRKGSNYGIRGIKDGMEELEAGTVIQQIEKLINKCTDRSWC